MLAGPMSDSQPKSLSLSLLHVAQSRALAVMPDIWACGVVFLYVVVRAATLDLTHDEALSFELFVSGGIYKLFGEYDASNHILYSMLARIFRGLFGLSEFALRLPSVFASALYLGAAVSFARDRFSNVWSRGFVVLILATNPLLLDHFSAARGYGLGCAFLAWGIVLACRFDARGGAIGESRSEAYVLGIVIGLSISSNLVFVVPAVAVLVWLGAVFLRSIGSATGSPPLLFGLYVNGLAGPAVFLPATLWALPLRTATSSNFYVGFDSLDQFKLSIGSLLLPAGFAGQWLPEKLRSVLRLGLDVVLLPELAIGFTVVILVAAATGWFRARSASATTKSAVATTFLFLLTAGITFFLWGVVGVKLPVMRTALPLLVCFEFAFVAGIAAVLEMGHRRMLLGAPLLAVAAVAVFGNVLSAPRDYFLEWRYDSQNREIVAALETEGRTLGREPSVLTSYVLSRSLRWYGERRNIAWLKRVPFPWERKQEPRTFDFVVLFPGDPIPGFVVNGEPWRRFETSGVEVYRNR
jgi:uncharacterized membrane protein